MGKVNRRKQREGFNREILLIRKKGRQTGL